MDSPTLHECSTNKGEKQTPKSSINVVCIYQNIHKDLVRNAKGICLCMYYVLLVCSKVFSEHVDNDGFGIRCQVITQM